MPPRHGYGSKQLRLRLATFLLLAYLAVLVLTVVMLVWPRDAEATGSYIPEAARHHQRELTRLVQQEFGLSAPVALHAAQVHQESAWRPHVRSHAGAEGLAQFMPSTSAWLVEVFPELGPVQPYSERWALRAMVRYNRWHFERIAAADSCERWAMTLSAYNGGLGWLRRDRRLAAAAGADESVWWGEVEMHTSRAEWARVENRYYVRRITMVLQQRYSRAGWQGGGLCQR